MRGANPSADPKNRASEANDGAITNIRVLRQQSDEPIVEQIKARIALARAKIALYGDNPARIY
jgi:hypothetical protein